MNGTLRQSMSWLHTWSGLLFGWILFAIFMTGTASYFRSEITRWMEPETGKPASFAVAAAGAQAHLMKVAANAQSWSISLPDERRAVTKVSWRPQPKPGERESRRGRGGFRRGMQADLDAATGAVVKPRETSGGEFFYRVHFQMHYMPVIFGRWVVGLCAMFMLVASIAGVITHKRIFADFFTFRPGKAAQRSWMDAHNLTAVLALPFHVMITYTGLVCIMTMYVPWGIKANYENPGAYFQSVFPRSQTPERAGEPAPLASIAQVVAKAQAIWGGGRPGNVSVQNPGDITARIEVTRHSGDQLTIDGGKLIFDGVTGALIFKPPPKGPGVVVSQSMEGLHMGRFAEPPLRWLYFLCSLIGCAMVATGLVLWTVKRRKDLPDPDRPHFGFRLVERMNIGTIAGVPAGMAAMLWANRLLPVEMAMRSAWEIHGFFILWAAMILYACLRPARRAWVETLAAAAFLVATLPVVSAVTTPQRSLWRTSAAGDWAMVAFDLTLFALGAALAFCAYKAAVYRPAIKAKGRLAAEKEVVA